MRKAHHQLLAWQLALELVEEIYRLTSNFPVEERFGLVSQMRRASVSVPANIAEGAARSSSQEFQRFLCIARASLMELETHLLLAEKLEFTTSTDHLHGRINRLYGLINGLIRRLETNRIAAVNTKRIKEQRAIYLRLTSNVSPFIPLTLESTLHREASA